MKVWLDILTPKQVNYLGALHHRLTSKGFKTILTTRAYREVDELLDLNGLKAIQVGRHGGGELGEKLLASSKRVSALTEVVTEEKPDVAISFSSPEAARVAFGLRIPHYCVSDSPHAEAVCRLTIPLSKKLFTPWVIPGNAWTKYGIASRDVVRYRALDPFVWLRIGHKNEDVAKNLGLDRSKPIITVRTPEEYAAYLTDPSLNVSDRIADVVGKILEVEGTQTVVLTRYEVQQERLQKRFGSRVVLPEHAIDAISLLRVSSLFIGGGGTMTAEAAMLGVPVISYYPGNATFVERFLISHGLAERILDSARIAHRAAAICKRPEVQEYYKKKSRKLVQSMEDPIDIIIERIFKRG